MTRGEFFYLFFNGGKDLRLLKVAMGVAQVGLRVYGEGFQRVGVFVVGGRKRRQQGGPQGTHLLTAVIVADRILEDALEQERQFRCRPGAIFLGQFHHGILDDILSGVLVPNGKERLFVSAPFDAGQKIGQFGTGCQG